MRKIILALAAFTCLTPGVTWADEDPWDWDAYDNTTYGQGAPGISGEQSSNTSTATEEEMMNGYMKNEKVSLTPQVGVLAFTDPLNASSSRAAYGFGADVNLLPMIDKSLSNFYGGISSGLLFSHLGDASSGFFGSMGGITTGTGGANMYVIPANLKVGYNIMDNFRVGAHGGGNVLYRSVGNAISLDAAGTSSPGSAWSMYPNVGADLEYAFNKNVGITLRPDWTFGTGNSFFLGTVGLGIALG